jgi:6,7-dimethyl-8-ribityllumazine synthase
MSGTSAPDLSAQLSSAGKRIAIVAARFNTAIVDRLVAGAYEAIARTGGDAKDVTLFHCPGAWELPQVTAQLLDKGFDAIIAFAGHASDGLGRLTQGSRTPILFGVLTTETLEQAIARADREAGNKGYEVTVSALEMIALFERIGKLGREKRAGF